MRTVFCFNGFNQTAIVLCYSARIKPRKTIKTIKTENITYKHNMTLIIIVSYSILRFTYTTPLPLINQCCKNEVYITNLIQNPCFKLLYTHTITGESDENDCNFYVQYNYMYCYYYYYYYYFKTLGKYQRCVKN